MKHPLRMLAILLLAAMSTRAAEDAWDAPGAANPILPGYYADPSLVQHEGKYYLYATLDPWGGKTLGCWESADFRNWTYRLLNWPTKQACTSKTSKGANVWAPSVVKGPGGKFYMYVSVGSEVWAGVADHPLGPWKNALGDKPMIPSTWNTKYHMIDAECFVDEDGSAYLYWGSGWNWKDGHCFAAKLKSDMVSFDGEVRDVTPANYFEGPFMLKHGGRYYLMYSQGVTVSTTYQVHYAIGDSPLGPFKEAESSPILVTNKERNIVSPGHHSAFVRDGKAYILYHRHSVPFKEGSAFRQMCVDEMKFTPAGLIEKIMPTHRGPALVQKRLAEGSLSAGASVSASSTLGATFGAERVLDDNFATRWAPAKDAAGAWVQMDLGEVKQVGRNVLLPESAWKTYRFALEGSKDGQAWTPLADHRQGATGSPIVIDQAAECRYLRLVWPEWDRNDPPGLFEWQVFGKAK